MNWFFCTTILKMPRSLAKCQLLITDYTKLLKNQNKKGFSFMNKLVVEFFGTCNWGTVQQSFVEKERYLKIY